MGKPNNNWDVGNVMVIGLNFKLISSQRILYDLIPNWMASQFFENFSSIQTNTRKDKRT